MKNQTSNLSIYKYTDYRKYLHDYYFEQKDRIKAFSYRYFARNAGINSIGLYRDVVEGRQKLGRALIIKFSMAIGHSKKEAEYFESMVFFNEAKTAEERKVFFDRMLEYQNGDTKSTIIDETRYEFYQKWYYSAVRSLVSFGKFKNDEKNCRRIGSILNPRIRPENIKKALRILKRLKFISEDSDGFLTLTDPVITTGILHPEQNVSILNIVNFQKEVTALANESLDRFGVEDINLSTLTLGVSDSTRTLIKDELIALRKKIAALAEKDKEPNRVYQLNMQFFPLSDRYAEGNGE